MAKKKSKPAKKSKARLWTIRVESGCQVSVHGPYKTEEEREEGYADFVHELDADDDLIHIGIDSRGNLDATGLSMEEVTDIIDQHEEEEEHDEDEEEEEDQDQAES